MKLHCHILLFFAFASITAGATPPGSSPLVSSVVEWPTMFPIRSKTTGETMVPGIEIYSDGTTIIKRRDGGEAAMHIDPKRISELLAYFRAQQLFEVTSKKISEDIRKAGPLPAPTDQPNTILFASTGVRSVTISQNAFPFFAEKYPQLDSLQTMSRCIRKIYEIAGEAP